MVLLRFNKENSEWDILTKEQKAELPEDVQEKEVFYLDGFLKEKCDFAKKQKARNNDVVGICVGDEGSGKSTIAGNVMRYMCEDEFEPTLHMIGDDDDGGIDKLDKLPQGGNAVFDEGNRFFLSIETMKKEQRNLHKIFSIFRQKNLFILIVLPSFFRLGSYFALDRSRFMLRTYLRDGERSFFEYYGNQRKDKLYRIGKKLHDYSCVSPTFRGRFTKCLQLESKEYKDFKLKTLRSAIESTKPQNKPKSEHELKQQLIKDLIANNSDKTTAELGSLLDVTPRRIRQIRADMQDGGAISP